MSGPSALDWSPSRGRHHLHPFAPATARLRPRPHALHQPTGDAAEEQPAGPVQLAGLNAKDWHRWQAHLARAASVKGREDGLAEGRISIRASSAARRDGKPLPAMAEYAACNEDASPTQEGLRPPPQPTYGLPAFRVAELTQVPVWGVGLFMVLRSARALRRRQLGAVKPSADTDAVPVPV